MEGKLTRKELKTDRFAVAVEHQLDFVSLHRTQVVRYAVVALALVLVGVGIYLYREHQRSVREEKLADAIHIQESPVTPAGQPGALSFPTEGAKRAAAVKAFSGIATEYSGSNEGDIAGNYLGAIAADQGKLDEARKRFQTTVDSGNKNYASLAKLSLAQIDFSENRVADGEKLLRGLMDSPTDLVSKEHAAIALARGIGKTKPAEARKLLEPLRTEAGAVSQAAINAISDLPSK
ncbi:MAG: tetratricopeptide repeat protein [Acidobacteriota bacterium]|nr:tetratricopeptide repeat protein [Acidobacteriota bacterium]